MQKKLLTVAVATALGVPGLALAQSSVEVYGDIHMAFGNFRYGQSSAGVAATNKWDVANGASNWGLRGRESIGGGLTAWFQIEQNAPLERSNNQAIKPASRNSAIGLQGAWGNAFMGQWTTPWADLDGLWNVGTVGFWGPVTSIIGRRETTGTAPNANCANLLPVPGSVLGTVNATGPICDAIEGGGGVGHAFWRRASNAVFYQSPVWSGAQFKLAVQTNEGKSVTSATAAGSSVASNPYMWSSSIQWAGMGGRARVGLAVDRHSEFTAVNRTDSGWAIKGGYNFGIVDVGAAIETMQYRALAGDVKARQYGVGVDFPIGSGSIKAAYSKAENMTGPAAAVATNTGARQWDFGYEHRFSKRTNIGLGYAKIDNNAAGAFTWTGAPPNQTGTSNSALAGQNVSTVFLSMRHRF